MLMLFRKERGDLGSTRNDHEAEQHTDTQGPDEGTPAAITTAPSVTR